MDITTQYLGMELCSPLVASPSPHTGRLDTLMRLEDAGVGAVVLPSLFEEEIEAEELVLYDRMESSAAIGSEADGYFPDLDLDHLGLERHLVLVQQAAERLAVPVIASLNGHTPGGWVRYARDLEEAGASAIELNTYEVVASPQAASDQVEQRYVDLVAEVRSQVSVPVSVKLSPYVTALANLATRLVGAGADGLVLFNRFYQPDLDLQTLDVTPHLELSSESDLRLPLRWVGILRPLLPEASLGLTSGVHSGEALLKALLVGADVAMTTSAVLQQGPERVHAMLEDMRAWMLQNEYASVRQLQGSVSSTTAADPTAYERAQYQRVLKSWTPTP